MKKIVSCLLLLSIELICFGQTIHIRKGEGGVYSIKCKLNSVPMEFIFDTGCNDVTISMLEAKFLIKQGLLDTADILSQRIYMTANGSTDTSITILIRRLEIDGYLIENVEGSIITNSYAPLLLGQTAINKMGVMVVDFKNGTIKIKN